LRVKTIQKLFADFGLESAVPTNKIKTNDLEQGHLDACGELFYFRFEFECKLQPTSNTRRRLNSAQRTRKDSADTLPSSDIWVPAEIKHIIMNKLKT